MGSEAVLAVRFFLIGVSVLLAFLAVATWNRRADAPEALPSALLVFAGMLYAFGYSGEVAQTTVPAAILWLHIEYLGLPWIPALWLLTARTHNGLKGHKLLIFAIPVITFVTHYTNRWHHLYTGPMTLVRNGPFYILTAVRGPFAQLDNAYLLVAFLAGAWIYLGRLHSASPLYRRQAAFLLASSLIPFTAYFVYRAGLSPWDLDISPFTLAISGVLYYYGLFHLGVFNLSPLARTHIFNCMRDAVMVVDTQHRLVDFNGSALTLLPVLGRNAIGQPLGDLLHETPQLAAALTSPDPRNEISMAGEGESRYFDVQTFPLLDGSRHLGHAAILANITPQVRLREELRAFAETDALTGIANRRRFLHALELECLRSSRYGTSFSLLLVDLDHFKAVNDAHGHHVGDMVLCQVVRRLQFGLRGLDLAARYGGEEFAILLPETEIEGAAIVAERIRSAIAANPINADGRTLLATVSIGIATQAGDRNSDPNHMLDEADRALYRAKANGRNRVEAWISPAL